MSEPTNLFWYSSVAVQFFFCIHLLWTRLAKIHPVFTLYLGCCVVRSLIAMRFTVAPNGALPLSYTYFWLWSEPVLLLLQIAVTLEVLTGIWKEHSAVVAPARTLLFFALVSAIAFAALPVSAELRHFDPARPLPLMQFEFLAKRYISSVLAIFLILSALLFLMVSRNSLKSSLFRHESMLAFYFGIYAICYLIVGLGWSKTQLVNHYMLSALTLCFVIWISVFKPPESTP
jgi:hypothetical protein